ncbi:regulator of chromosome condensation (RCC1) repeat domain containing protein [Acanthamoeba castellanii str. Neff]|uniref:Regulator of chromosome condensation (RCC1) repeat domain containing protein n=1 Tax=Acanthamoeba castellanii (strain ATCC 30010 / Neff) TaxID=1257118 RepID=L8GQA0_ACACF|nr:regulator of chromosome condensation (RCC1) repeat domain containing protein [Acanthamoeba castellanii str. Neff]ELR15150.1 regulator of chromosome condensation (RCC1) repeat domain containing protein [Acanthamoeba castellanii str. Neff]
MEEKQDEGVSPREAIALMKRGCSFLKCGSRGSPHFRELKLSGDLTTLSWTSPKKTSNQSTIDEIRIGQNTPVFKKNRKPEYENVSFSIIYGDKTLDLVSKNVRERDIWVQGLKVLTLEPHLLSEVDSVATDEEKVSVKFKGKRTIVEKREVSNDNGRVGHGDEEDHKVPRVVEALLGKDVRGIACGAAHTAAWNGAGVLYTWGAGQGRLGHDHERDRFIPLEVSALGGKKVVQAACGYAHTAAITDAGRVYTWGQGKGGVLGHGDESACSTPREVASLALQVIVVVIVVVVVAAVVAGGSGTVYAWGGNEKGQLGFGDRTPRMSPALLADLSSISRIACTYLQSNLPVKRRHRARQLMMRMWTWGDGASGQLGHGTEEEELVPRQVMALEQVNIIAVAAGKAHTAALTSQGEVWTWGDGSDGQLGHGAAILRYCKPLLIESLKDSGHLYAWGNSRRGALGGGLAEEVVSVPRAVEAMEGKKVKAVACGKRHCAALVLHAWIPDEESTLCMACKAPFTMIRRRHHCRNCGGLFCGSCSSKRIALLDAGFASPVRVCDRCHSSRTSTG